MAHKAVIPRYIQEIYIWVLKMKQPLDSKSMSEHECVHVIELNNGELFMIDVHSMHDFLKDYLTQ